MSLMNEKLGKVKKEEFVEAVEAVLATRRDYEKLKDAVDKEQITEICEEIYENKVYRMGTLRGAVNAVVRRLTSALYEVVSAEKIRERIEKGELRTIRGVVFGSYDREQTTKDGGSFMKQFVPVVTPEGIEEVTVIGKHVGGERIGKPIPYFRGATYVIDDNTFLNSRTGEEVVDPRAIRVQDITEDELDFMSVVEEFREKGKIYTMKKLAKDIADSKIENFTWILFEGVVNDVQPTPVFENGVLTDEKMFLTYINREDEMCFTFQLKARGTMTSVVEKWYPTIRLYPVEVAKTYVDWGDLTEWIDNLIKTETLNPETQLMTLADQVIGRKFYALARYTGETFREFSRPDGSVDSVHFVNLVAVAIVITNEVVDWEPIEATLDSQENVEEKKSEQPKQKKKVEVKVKVDWKNRLIEDVKMYLEVVPDATFEDMKEAKLFENYSDVPEAALKKIVEDLLKGD